MSTTPSSDESHPAAAAAAQHIALGLDLRGKGPVSIRPEHPEAQWFGQAGLGLMVHWGIASVHGGIDLSWGMMANTPWDAAGAPSNKITPEEYWKLQDRFHPDRYDPGRWLKAAKEAGFRYAVFTAMHHDGYTLWPSAHSEFGVQGRPGGSAPDLVGPFLEACRRHGLKAGLYLSPPDWHFDRKQMSFNYPSFAGRAALKDASGCPEFDERHLPATITPPSPAHLLRRRELFHARVTELLTRYGRIDLLWFDGGTWDNEIRDRALALQPHLVINSRICQGHFESTECRLPKERPTTWLETCHCWQSCDIPTPGGDPVDVWGYLNTETYKSSAWMLSALSRLRSWGGNFLVNVGPRPDGSLPAVVYERLNEVAHWMKHSGPAVLDAAPAPAPDPCAMPVTVGEGRWYLHFPPEQRSPIRIRLPFEPGSARLMATGNPVALVSREAEWEISLPETERSGLVDVVEIIARDGASS